jgi:hypothetical protein
MLHATSLFSVPEMVESSLDQGQKLGKYRGSECFHEACDIEYIEQDAESCHCKDIRPSVQAC